MARLILRLSGGDELQNLIATASRQAADLQETLDKISDCKMTAETVKEGAAETEDAE